MKIERHSLRSVRSVLGSLAFAAGVALVTVSCGPDPSGGESSVGGDAGAIDGADVADGAQTDTARPGCEGDAEDCSCSYNGTSRGVCGDARVDPETGTCSAPAEFESTESSCGDGLDNDCDGDADCQDADCTGKSCGLGQGTAKCVAKTCKELNCQDGRDNDQDGAVDCRDSDCTNETCAQGTERTCPPPDDWQDDETRCDGIDNDCDGAVDEGCDCVYDPSESTGVDTDGSHDFGVCTGSTRDDNGECVRPSAFETRSGDESACMGRDNDCDGTTDEGCGCTYDPNDSDSTDTDGSHKSGVCVNQESASDGSCTRPNGFESRTDAESDCDGRDNDCDGAIDEGCSCIFDPGEGNNADTDGSHNFGVCTRRTRNNRGLCRRPGNFEQRTNQESDCDGKDNDCDGAVDEGCSCTYDPNEPSDVDSDRTHDSGVCTGEMVATNGSCTRPSAFEGTQGDAESGSSCIDSVDNDCDGSTDEGCPCDYDPNESRDVDTNGDHGVGVCTGQQIDASTGQCTRPNGFDAVDDEQSAGNCDTVDNDCDGVADEHCPCNYNGTATGVCSNGERSPGDGSCSIAPQKYESKERSCDGKDNDCDGATDEWTHLNCMQLTDFGSSAQRDTGTAIAVRPSGLSYVGGTTRGQFGGEMNAGEQDGFVAKFDAAGNRQWVRIFGSSRDDEVAGAAVDGNGNLYVTGETRGAFGSESNSGSYDAFLAKYDSNGNRQWLTIFGTPSTDRGYDVAVDSSNEAYVVGGTSGSLGGRTNNGASDGFLAHFNSSGSRQWVRLVGSTDSDGLRGVATGSSSIYAVGSAEGAVAGQSFGGIHDGLVVKYGSSGSRSWVRLSGGSSNEVLRAAAVDSAGDVFMGGGAPGGGSAYFGKFDASGNRKWWKSVGSDTEARGAAVLPTGRAVFVGETDVSIWNQAFNGGAGDGFAVEYSSAGTRKWSKLFGTSDWDGAQGVGIDSDGDVLSTGRWKGAVFGSPDSDVSVGVLK